MTKYWNSLDGLRAVAVALVLLAHAGSPYPKSGGVGVDVFFVLSGFLITGILSKEFNKEGGIDRKRFYIRRLLRLTPPLLACLLIFSIFYYWIHNEFRWDIVAIGLTYLGNYARALYNYDMNAMGHSWSLAIEEQFYLFWPFAISFLERKKKGMKSKALVLLGLAIILALYRALGSSFYSPSRIYFALDTHMDGLVIGSALYYGLNLLTDWSNRENFLKLVSYILLPLSLMALILIMALYTWKDIEMALFGYFSVALCACVIITDLVSSPYSFIKRGLEWKPLTYIGKISYGLYLYHMPVYYFVRNEYPDLDKPIKLFMMVTISFAVTILSYHFYEKRFLRLKKHF